ncbi:hypothetical protein ACFQE8_05975 [Salinirubellus sp. GCM10025818]|uniref:hypothetical protein n=1 Tax=Salinirubellus TaxID=2162630 RepID=UPI0030CCAD3F
MPDWSRRRALQAATAAAALALAGCSGEESSSNEIPRARGDPVSPSEFEVTFVRDTDGEPLFAVGEDGVDEDGVDEGGRGIEYLTDEADREELTFRSTEPAAELRAFVDEADLESRSVYLLQRPIGECYEARLVGVYRETDGVDADFCQALRSANVECSAEDRDTVGVAIRLPFSGDSFSGYGAGWSGDCDRGTAVAREGGDGT